EQVLEIDGTNVDAMDRLEEMYNKRRDWERLIGIRQRKAEMAGPDDRPLIYIEIAQLASERLRKPEMCIELWDKVLEFDEENPEALSQLANLHKRARNWEPLARILEKSLDGITNEKELKTALQELATIYGDKIGDDAGAVRALKRLLELDPEDRRAQEALKKRYSALKAWDE